MAERDDLRERAERAVAASNAGAPLSQGSLEQLVHELQVHQVELEMQNDELRRVQRELAESRDRYFELYDLAPVGYLSLDEGGRVVEANLAAAEAIGVARKRLIGTPLSRWMGEADADRFALLRASLRRGGKAAGFDLVIHRGDGAELPALLTTTVVAPNGGFRAILVDVAEKRRMEGELRESLSRFRQIAETVDDVFWLAAPDGELLYVSPAFERRFGRAAAGLRAIDWLDLVHPEDRGRFASQRQAASGAAIDVEYRMIDARGRVRLVRERAFASEIDRRVVGIVHDVTEERRTEEELRHAQRMEAIGTLASGIAHDFNNLLMGITGMAELAMRRLPKGHRAIEVLARIKDAAFRGSSLTRQLIDFGANRTSEAEPIVVDEVLEESRDLIVRLVGDHVAVVFDLRAAAARVRVIPGDIGQLVLNLVTNARDAMPGGGAIQIRTNIAADALELRVIDNGAGMDEDTRARIFEPFFTTKATGKGTGLGLSTVFAVCRRLRGKIQVDSELGRGTTFTIRLPLVAGLAVTKPSSEPAEDDAGGRVLVVDDDAPVREMLLRYLGDLGYVAAAAADAEEARLLCERLPFDVLLTDVMLPRTFGNELAAELTARDPELTVVFMSAHPRADLERLGRVPHDAFLLEKPFDERALARALSKVRRARKLRGMGGPGQT